jgi:hypothetical protein
MGLNSGIPKVATPSMPIGCEAVLAIQMNLPFTKRLLIFVEIDKGGHP